jgi:hypothetical protein
MFPNFERTFAPDDTIKPTAAAPITDYPKLTSFLGEYGGRSFARGLYRIVKSDEISLWDERIGLAYPEYAGRVTCFAYDWLGRAFGLDGLASKGPSLGFSCLNLEPGMRFRSLVTSRPFMRTSWCITLKKLSLYHFLIGGWRQAENHRD